MSKKVLTIIIPAYNSEVYLERALISLLAYKENLDIIIVNDGSTDKTASIAQTYVERYPDAIRLLNKANGGHGSAINLALKYACGTYVKVLDSDDYFVSEALEALVMLINELTQNAIFPDLIFTDYTLEILKQNYRPMLSEFSPKELYPLQRDKKFFYIDNKLGHVLPSKQLFAWDEVKKWSFRDLLIMHTLCYRLDFLRSINLCLPEGVFYEDNYYSLVPLQSVKSMFYLPVNLYVYYIGRPDQSVNLQKIIKNYRHQVKVIKAMLHNLHYDENLHTQAYVLKDLTVKHMARMYEVCQLIYLLEPTDEHKSAVKEVKAAFKSKGPQLWHSVKRKKLVIFLNFACRYLLGLAQFILACLRKLKIINV